MGIWLEHNNTTLNNFNFLKIDELLAKAKDQNNAKSEKSEKIDIILFNEWEKYPLYNQILAKIENFTDEEARNLAEKKLAKKNKTLNEIPVKSDTFVTFNKITGYFISAYLKEHNILHSPEIFLDQEVILKLLAKLYLRQIIRELAVMTLWNKLELFKVQACSISENQTNRSFLKLLEKTYKDIYNEELTTQFVEIKKYHKIISSNKQENKNLYKNKVLASRTKKDPLPENQSATSSKNIKITRSDGASLSLPDSNLVYNSFELQDFYLKMISAFLWGKDSISYNSPRELQAYNNENAHYTLFNQNMANRSEINKSDSDLTDEKNPDSPLENSF